ncbi:universal stress protein [Actinoplanes sp. TRM 88003]|uniref:Universal stress protein n=1 Tax=Paractinoplanes aksuensis TaxID=2939490 RepID=A0ABT1DTJ7_9ACTN|nr:universal stress protein [Actinoplanes aksuensis]MCO8274140.1 universal stress protein [Actinoplanes aksuensis]
MLANRFAVRWIDSAVPGALVPGGRALTLCPRRPRLLEMARDAELLVVGNPGRSGLAALRPDSLSRRIATHAPGSVVLVRAHSAPEQVSREHSRC